MRRKIVGGLLVAVGDAGAVLAVAALYKGMRDVMVNNGGFCASGGPYAIAAGHQCASSDTVYVLAGILGLFLFGAVGLAATAWLDGPALATGLGLWGLLFGALGWNFLDLGLNPPSHGSGAGWIVCGVLFWAMALGGLVPVAGMALGWARRGGKPEPPTGGQLAPLVRAVVPRD